MKRPMTLCVTSPNEEPLSRRIQIATWESFLRGGTRHSGMAMTLPYIVRRCEREGRPYAIEAYPGVGYVVKPIGKFVEEATPFHRKKGEKK